MPNFNAHILKNSLKLQRQTEKILMKADRIFRYVILSYFLLGLSFAPFSDSWTVALFAGGTNLTIYLFTQLHYHSGKMSRVYYGFGLALFCVQFIWQSGGSVFMHIFFFNTIFLFVILQNKRYFLNFFLMLLGFYVFLLISYLDEGVFLSHFLYTKKQSDWSVFFVFLPLIQVVVFLYFIINFIKGNLLNRLKQIIHIEESSNINQNTSLALEIAQGKTVSNYQLREDDLLGQALLKVKDNLAQMQARETQQKWYSIAIASISDLLLSEPNLNRLAAKTLRELVRHLDAQYGGIYLANQVKGEEYLRLVGTYAGNKRQKTDPDILISPGEGLIGEVFHRGETIEITNIPDDHQFIYSGLGGAKPKVIHITPLIVKNTTLGVIEIASFDLLSDDRKKFLANACESIAIAVDSAISAQRTQVLLEESQQLNQQAAFHKERVEEANKKIKKAYAKVNALQDEGKEYRKIIDTLGQIESAFVYYSPKNDETLTYLSKSFEQITGFSVDDFLNNKQQNLRSLVHKPDTEKYIYKLAAAENQVSTRYRIRNKMGKVFTVQDISVLTQHNSTIERIGIVKKVYDL